MNRFINLNLLAHPLNWATVFIWMVFFGFTVAILEPVLLRRSSAGTPASGG